MKKLHDLDVSEVSLVPRGANKKKFLIFKSASGGAAMNEELHRQVTSVSKKTMQKVEKVLSGKKSVKKDEKANLSDRAKLALRASARILAPHKDEISTDHLHEVANAIGIGGGPEDAGMPLEGSAGQGTPLQSDEPAPSNEMGKAPVSMDDNKMVQGEMGKCLEKAFSVTDDKEDEMKKGKGEDQEDELSGLKKVEGDSGEDADEASGLEKEEGDDEEEGDGKKHQASDDADEEDEAEEGDEEDDAEKSYGDMSPEKVEAHKAGMAAYKAAVEHHVKKLGSRMHSDEKELMKANKDGKPVEEEEEVGKTSVSKSDSLDLTAVPEKVRPAVEQIFKSQKELVKKNAELQTQITEMQKAAKRKELVAKAATFKHYTGDRNALVDQMLELDAVNPKLREGLEKQLETLDAQKEGVAKSLFNEIGSALPSAGNDAEAKIDAAVNAIVQKGGSKTKEQIYEEYMRTSEGQALYRDMKNSRVGGI